MRLGSEHLLDHIYYDDSHRSLAEDMNKLPVIAFAGPEHGLSCEAAFSGHLVSA